MKKIKAGIVGGAGYTAGELIRLLLIHPTVELTEIFSTSNSGRKVYEVHADLIGETELSFTDKITDDIDVLFFCIGHGETRSFLEKNNISSETRIIDLSHDFRLQEYSSLGTRNFVYGLPELNRNKIVEAKNIANPGCFATAIQLALLPFAKENMLSEVHCTAITGSTGAGRALQESTQFNWRSSNVSAYKTLEHQHLDEIQESIATLQGNNNAHINFIPWRGPFARGIHASLYFKCNLELNNVYDLFNKYYENHPFTIVSTKPISLKQVVNTNKCLLHLEKVNDTVVIHSAIDNLLKGASGQAVQNMNLMFGLPEVSGLQLKSIVY